MIVAAFINGPSGADDWVLPHKLRVMSEVCDRVCVLLDRPAQSTIDICRRFHRVEWRTYESRDLPPAHDGPQWDEGAMRQVVWDWATEWRPRYVLLGDTDEIPAPSIVGLLGAESDMRPSSADLRLYYADWVNLIGDVGHAIGGQSCPWSWQAPGSNKKGMIVRFNPRRQYTYSTATRHVRIEPSPVHPGATVYEKGVELGPVPLLHYRWANWPRWQTSAMAVLPHYQPWPSAKAQVVDVPREWIWQWDADALLRGLPGPIAVVGNGRCEWKGEEIDAHPTVIRFNNFHLDGFADHVGRKTDAWYTNCWDDVHPRQWTAPMLTGYTHAEQPDRLNRWLGTHPHMHVAGSSWFDDARKIKQHPSHGLVLLNRLLHHGREVHAYGFDGLTTGHAWDSGHRHTHGTEAAALEVIGRRGVAFR